MNTLYILLVFGVLLYSLYNAIIYDKRRLEDKKSTKEALETMVFHRELTEEERSLLDELQKEKEFKKTHKRIDNKVYLIKGAYKRHGIETRYNTTWHNFIGGLEVTIDDRALDYIREVNIAEVIKTDKLPLVIGLNHDFSLVNHIITEKQIEKGEVGKIAGSDVELISNRKQTSFEVQAVEKVWKGTIGAFLTIPALFLMALTALGDVYSIYGAIPGGILFVVALYFLWRKPKFSKPEAIRTLKGVITYSATIDNSENIQQIKPFMGNIELKFEKRYWLPFMIAYTADDIPVEVDISKDGWLMRFGSYLSLETEEKKYPSQPWYRHVIMTVTAIIALIVSLISVPGLTNNIRSDAAYYLTIFKQLSLYAPAIFMVLNLILIIIHAPLAYKSYHYNKQRIMNTQKYYEKLIPLTE